MKKIILWFLFCSASCYAAPETYRIDPAHTLPRFTYNHLGYSTQAGRFNQTSGTITLDRNAKTGAADIVIDAKSVDMGWAIFNAKIQQEGLFDTEFFPRIIFKSHDFQFDAGQLVAVHGELTIKWVTRPVTLKVDSFLCMPHPLLQKMACGVTATATIKRSQFGMAKYVPYVGDEITLTLPVEAIQE